MEMILMMKNLAQALTSNSFVLNLIQNNTTMSMIMQEDVFTSFTTEEIRELMLREFPGSINFFVLCGSDPKQGIDIMPFYPTDPCCVSIEFGWQKPARAVLLSRMKLFNPHVTFTRAEKTYDFGHTVYFDLFFDFRKDNEQLCILNNLKQIENVIN